MLSISRAQWQKFGLLTSLYIAQGLPYGFFTQALPALLREQGISLETIGLASLLALPWATKWLYAPLVDRQHNHRRWIILTNLCAIATCLLLARFPLAHLVQHKLWLLYGGFFILNLAAATQDIATDAIAVIQLSESERGIGNGIQVAGYRVGMILSGGALLAWFSLLGWQSSILILAAMLGLATLPILLIRPAMPGAAPSGEQFGGKAAFWLLLRPENRIWLAILCLYKSGEALAMPMLRPMLVDAGHTLDELAWLIGTVGFGTGLLGSMLSGLLINRLGTQATLRWFLAANGLTLFAWAMVAAWHPGAGWLQLASGIEHFTGGMATVALFSEMMAHCRRQHEATDYTLQSCLVVLINILGASVSGFLAKGLGYTNLFLLCGVLSFMVLPLLWRYQRHPSLPNEV
jgi:MFS family permease